MSLRVLLVDDDESVRRSLGRALTRAGFTVTVGGDASVMSLSGQFDIVVADYNIPTTSGPEVVRHFKARHGADVFCVVLSGDDDDAMRAACETAGVDAMVSKPVPIAELRRLLTGAVRRAA